MNLDIKLSVPSQVISRVVGEETVLLDLKSGLYFGLDSVGRRIWECVSEGQDLMHAVDAIVGEFEVERGRAEADVLEFATTLVERGLLAE